MTRTSYDDVNDLRQDILFSKQDVIEYIRRHHLEKKILGEGGHYSETGPADGRYLVKKNDKYMLYDQERGIRREERTFDSREDALAYLEGDSSADDHTLKRWVDAHLSIYL